MDRRLEECPAPLFAPLGLALPLRVEQTDWNEFTTDPALASFTLRSAQSVLGADALTPGFDDWAEAEAAGRAVERAADGTVTGSGAALDAPVDPDAAVAASPLSATTALTARLAEEIGDTASVLGCLSAPATLLARLYGDKPSDAQVEAAGQLAVKAIDALCGTGVAAILLLEDAPADPGLFGKFDAAFNLAAYYQVPVLYLSRVALKKKTADAARKAGARWALGPGDVDGLVAAVPLKMFEAGADVAGWATAVGGAKLFLSAWALPADCAVEAVIAARDALCG